MAPGTPRWAHETAHMIPKVQNMVPETPNIAQKASSMALGLAYRVLDARI